MELSIYETGVIKMHLLFKCDKLFWMFHTIDITKQREPEWLTFSFFVTFIFPICSKLSCCFFLLCIVHFIPPPSIPKNQIILKNFSASVIAASFSGGHFGCLEFSDFGLL